MTWHKHRGPGDITYDTDEIRLQNNGDPKLFVEAKTNAYFSEPGEYIVRGQVNDQTGNGGGGDSVLLDQRVRSGEHQAREVALTVHHP